MSESIQTCPKCARPIRGAAAKGLCPVCLVSSLLEPVDGAAEEVPEMPAPAAPAECLGHYELLEELGRGGMGVVFRARDLRLHRLVALKLILTGRLASDLEVKRFRTEAEAAAQLEHPNIVPIYEVGESDGRHFFAMKFMEGGTLAPLAAGRAQADSGPSDPVQARTAALLIRKLARGVHHAHQRGILHRDLKPGNILLDAAGEPAVSDFGLAKRLAGADSGMVHADLTLSSTALGSPAYMAPEQAAGRSSEVTTAADIYSLGAVLYYLLAGRPPFEGETPLEVMRQVVETEPVPPSKRVLPESGKQARRTALVPADLEIICLKCLEKNPARRYASAAELADDLDRWLGGEAILARPTSAPERVWKWARRRPATAALAFLSVLTLAGFVGLQKINAARLTRERDKAQAQEKRARESAHASRLNLYASDMFLAARALEQGNLGLARRTLAAHLPGEGEEDLRGFEWRHYWYLAQGQQEHVLGGFSNAVTSVAFSSDGRWLAAGGGHLVLKWNATNLLPVATFRHDPKAEVNSVAFSPDGNSVWAGESKGQLRVWLDGMTRPFGEITRGTGLVHIAVPAGSAGSLAISERNGLEGGALGSVSLYSFMDLLARNERGNPLPKSGGLAAYSRDGQWLLTGGGRDRAALHNVKSGETSELGGWSALLMALALSPDGARAALSPNNGTGIALYDLRATPPTVTSVNINWRCRALAYSPDGQTLAAAGYDHTVRLLNANYGYVTHRFDGHTDQVLSVAFSPDGRTLASASKDGTVRVWDVGNTQRERIHGVFSPYVLSHDGRTLWAGNVDDWRSTVCRRELDKPDLAPVPVLRLSPERFPCLERQLNGLLRWRVEGGAAVEQWKKVEDFIARDTNRIIWRRGPEGQPGVPDRMAEGVRGVSASAANASVLAMADRGKVRLWDSFGSRRLPDPQPAPREVRRMALSDDGRWLAVAAATNSISVWDTATGTPQFRLPARARGVVELLFSPDARLLAVAGEDATVELIEAGTGTLRATLTGHEVSIETMAFTPDGRTLATLAGQWLKFWHLATMREVGTVPLSANHLGFSGDGALLMAVAWNGEGRLLRAPLDPSGAR